MVQLSHPRRAVCYRFDCDWQDQPKTDGYFIRPEIEKGTGISGAFSCSWFTYFEVYLLGPLTVPNATSCR
jgi:hypothetical protein